MIQGLLKVPVLKVGVSELGVCRHEEEEVLLVNVDEELAER